MTESQIATIEELALQRNFFFGISEERKHIALLIAEVRRLWKLAESLSVIPRGDT